MPRRESPYLPLYVQDVLTDEKLIECSAAAHGVYFRLLCLFHKQVNYGKILLKQKSKQSTKQIKNFACALAKHFPFSAEEIELALDELVENDVIQLNGDELSQRRMVADSALSDKRAKSGEKGGKSTTKKKNFAQAKSQANADIDIDNDNESETVFGKGVLGEKPNPAQFPTLETPCELSELDKTLTIELLSRTKKGNWSSAELSDMFEGFKIQNFTGEKFYENHGAVVSHFRNWMKIQKKQINGKSNEPGSNSRAKIAALKNW